MAITVVQAIAGFADSANSSVTVGTGGPTVEAGDFLVMLRSTDDDGLSNFGTPTSGSGSGPWSLQIQTNSGANTGAQAWTAPVSTGGSKLITSVYSGSGDNGYCVFVLRNQHGTTPVDDTTSLSGATLTACALPSMDATDVDDLYVAGWGHRLSSGITKPASMTLVDAFVGFGGSHCFAYEQLSASGATGTRTATVPGGDDDDFSGVGLLIRSAGAAAPEGSGFLPFFRGM